MRRREETVKLGKEETKIMENKENVQGVKRVGGMKEVEERRKIKKKMRKRRRGNSWTKLKSNGRTCFLLKSSLSLLYPITNPHHYPLPNT